MEPMLYPQLPLLTAPQTKDLAGLMVDSTKQNNVCCFAYQDIQDLIKNSDGETYVNLIRSIVDVLVAAERQLEQGF